MRLQKAKLQASLNVWQSDDNETKLACSIYSSYEESEQKNDLSSNRFSSESAWAILCVCVCVYFREIGETFHASLPATCQRPTINEITHVALMIQIIVQL